MERKSRGSRLAIYVPPHMLEKLDEARGAWYETGEEVEAGLEYGRRKAELLRWVRRQMGRRLTKREQTCVELYYFGGLPYTKVAENTNTSPSSACRAVQRSLRKLRQAASEDTSWRKWVPLRPRRRRRMR